MHRLLTKGARAALIGSLIASPGGLAIAARAQAADAKQPPAARPTDRSGADAKAPGDRGGDSKTGGGGTARAGGTGRGGGGQPRNASVVLGASDVYRVKRGTLEIGLPIAGDLRAVETASVRSRVDGVLENVAVREGQYVRAGAILARFESGEQESALRSAEADQAAAKSDFETSSWNADQSKELFRVGAISERDLRAAQQASDASRARLAATDSRLKVATNVVRDTRVVAPFSGTIDKRKVQNGENTSRGTEMFTLVRSDVLELTATVPSRRASEVKAGQLVRFMADGRQFEGRVARLSPTLDPASRSLTVYVQMPNPRGEIKGNTFASGQIIAKRLDGVMVVPQSAIRGSPDQGKPFVWRIQAGELASAPIDVGVSDDARGMVEVVDGLKDGDDIVVGSPGTLGKGMKVQIIGNEGRGGRGGDGRSGRGGREGAGRSSTKSATP